MSDNFPYRVIPKGGTLPHGSLGDKLQKIEVAYAINN